MKSYYFYGYKFRAVDIADRYKDLPFEGYPYQIVPALEKYLATSSEAKMGSVSFLERGDFKYLGYLLKFLETGDAIASLDSFGSLFNINYTKHAALIKAWKEVKLTKTEMSQSLGYWFV